ncbi:RnfH family protein [Salinisphaera sp. T31B1]|uniref:RnfH family protein n=1 Tax=Salinisphaera sp. T31B1 TaxID=727963 RepID=UPI00333F1BD3
MNDASIEVVLALPGRCWRERVALTAGLTVETAATASGLAGLCERLTGERPAYGIYGRKVDAQQSLRVGDRIELYRSLLADPRARRRARARDQG